MLGLLCLLVKESTSDRSETAVFLFLIPQIPFLGKKDVPFNTSTGLDLIDNPFIDLQVSNNAMCVYVPPTPASKVEMTLGVFILAIHTKHAY